MGVQDALEFECDNCRKKKILMTRNNFPLPLGWIMCYKGGSNSIFFLGDEKNSRKELRKHKDNLIFCSRRCIKKYIDKITLEGIVK